MSTHIRILYKEEYFIQKKINRYYNFKYFLIDWTMKDQNIILKFFVMFTDWIQFILFIKAKRFSLLQIRQYYPIVPILTDEVGCRHIEIYKIYYVRLSVGIHPTLQLG